MAKNTSSPAHELTEYEQLVLLYCDRPTAVHLVRVRAHCSHGGYFDFAGAQKALREQDLLNTSMALTQLGRQYIIDHSLDVESALLNADDD